LHRQWFEHSAMGDLLGADFGQLAESEENGIPNRRI
jgi:hypothetical protein